MLEVWHPAAALRTDAQIGRVDGHFSRVLFSPFSAMFSTCLCFSLAIFKQAPVPCDVLCGPQAQGGRGVPHGDGTCIREVAFRLSYGAVATALGNK